MYNNYQNLSASKNRHDAHSPISRHLQSIEKVNNDLKQTLNHINDLISNITK